MSTQLVTRITVLLLLALASAAEAQNIDTYEVFSSHGPEQIGHLIVKHEGSAVSVDFHYTDNGRGPGTKSAVVLDTDGMPKSWNITGTSYAGGPVNEHFERSSSGSIWNGPAERGSTKDRRKLYVAAAGDPWATALYIRLALSQPGGTIDVLPGGTLHAQKRGSYTFGTDSKSIKVDLYMIYGLDLDPQFVLLDESGELFASLEAHPIVRAGYGADEYARFKQLFEAQVGIVLAELHQKVAHHIDVPWRITNVHIFDPTTQSLGPVSTVRIFENRIVRVEPGSIGRVPVGEKLVDGQGGTLMAGLVDMHAHEDAWNGLNRLASGITTIRDMGNNNAELLKKIYQRRLHLLDGPRVARAGFVDGKSPYSSQDGITIDSQVEGIAAVDWYADHDYPFLKLYNSVHPEWVQSMIDEARQNGMKTIGHIPAGLTADQAIEMGYAEVTHINMLLLQYVLQPREDTRTGIRLTAMHRFADLDLASPAVRHTIDLMKQKHVALDTTDAAMERLNIQRDNVTPDGDALYLDHMPIQFQRDRRRQFLEIPDKKTDLDHFRARDKIIELTGILHREGITLWPGTDDGVAYTLHHELRLYQKAGIPAAEVLKIDTYDTIKYLGLDGDLGTIEKGKLADLILIPGNPIEDITALRNVSLVVQDGTVYFPSEIYELTNVRPFSSAPKFVEF